MYLRQTHTPTHTYIHITHGKEPCFMVSLSKHPEIVTPHYNVTVLLNIQRTPSWHSVWYSPCHSSPASHALMAVLYPIWSTPSVPPFVRSKSPSAICQAPSTARAMAVLYDTTWRGRLHRGSLGAATMKWGPLTIPGVNHQVFTYFTIV